MTQQVDSDIWKALKKGIVEACNDLSITYDVAYPGNTYYPEMKPYIRVAYIPSPPVRMFIGNNRPHDRTGMLILTPVFPILNVDYSEYLSLPSDIAHYFYDGKMMLNNDVCVIVDGAPYVSPGGEDNGWWDVPVRINWRCFN